MQENNGMSVRINCNNKEILHWQNSIVDGIYTNIIDEIATSNIELSENLKKVLEHLYLATLGWDFDIADYLKTKEEFLAFANLVKNALDKEQASKYPYIPLAEKLLIDFCNEVILYANKLP